MSDSERDEISNIEIASTPIESGDVVDSEKLADQAVEEAKNVAQEVSDTTESFLSEVAADEKRGLSVPETGKTVSAFKRLRDRASEIYGEIKQSHNEKKLMHWLLYKGGDFEKFKATLDSFGPEFKFPIETAEFFVQRNFRRKDFPQSFSLMLERFGEQDKKKIFNTLITDLSVDDLVQVIEEVDDFGIVLDDDLLSKLINRLGYYNVSVLIMNAPKFGVGLDSKYVKKLVKNFGQDGARGVLKHFDLFSNLDVGAIDELIPYLSSKDLGTIIKDSSKFGIVPDAAFASKIIAENYSGKMHVLKNLKYFKDLNSDIANLVFGVGYDSNVLDNLSHFSNLDVGVAKHLVSTFGRDAAEVVFNNINCFSSVDKEIAYMLMDNIGGMVIDLVVKNPEKFGVTMDADFASYLLNNFGFLGPSVFISQIDNFSNLNADVADLLLRMSRGSEFNECVDLVFNNKEKFGVNFDNKYADEIMRKLGVNAADYVIKNPEKFGVTLDVDYAHHLLVDFGDSIAEVAYNKLDMFGNLDANFMDFFVRRFGDRALNIIIKNSENFGIDCNPKSAEDFIDKFRYAGAEVVINNSKKFGITLDSKYAEYIIDKLEYGGVTLVITNFDLFSSLDTGGIIEQLLTQRPAWAVEIIIKNPEKFGVILSPEYAEQLISRFDSQVAGDIIENLAKFGVNPNPEYAKRLIEKFGAFVASEIVKNYKEFGITLDAEYADYLIDKLGVDGGRIIMSSLTLFSELNIDIADRLIDFLPDTIRIIEINPEKFGVTLDAKYFGHIIKKLGLKVGMDLLLISNKFGLDIDDILGLNSKIDEGREDAIEDSALIRRKIVLVGVRMAENLRKSDFSIFEKYPELSVDGEKPSVFIENFIKEFSISNKGVTIISLCASKVFFEGMTEKEFAKSLLDTLAGYKKIIERYSNYNIPKGCWTTGGVEVEIAHNVGKDFSENWKGAEFKREISFLSAGAGVGQGRDGLHEVATRPTDNPALLLLELKLLQDLEFVDFNFDLYKKAWHGFHLTIGGESNLVADESAQFIQNMLVMSGWGGINTGKDVHDVARGRSVPLRQREPDTTVQVFGKPTRSVELRSLSIDSWESFERSVLTAYNCGIANQLANKYFTVDGFEKLNKLEISDLSDEELLVVLKKEKIILGKFSSDAEKQIVLAWARMSLKTQEAVRYHNDHFLEENYNEDVMAQLVGDKATKESIEKRFRIDLSEIVNPISVELTNKLSFVNNLFLKPSLESGGDVVNTRAVLGTTKIGGKTEESRRTQSDSMFDRTNVPLREGYYYYQKASENFITHRIQSILLEFNKEMENILTAEQTVDLVHEQAA